MEAGAITPLLCQWALHPQDGPLLYLGCQLRGVVELQGGRARVAKATAEWEVSFRSPLWLCYLWMFTNTLTAMLSIHVSTPCFVPHKSQSGTVRTPVTPVCRAVAFMTNMLSLMLAVLPAVPFLCPDRSLILLSSTPRIHDSVPSGETHGTQVGGLREGNDSTS